jgi:site-specific DNA-cytosine methylase
MREIHLFAGIGGGIYGGKLLNHKCIEAIEIDEFCRSVLYQRQKDNWLDNFNIKGDLTKISGDKYLNKFDILCGGFPCQAFSTAARGRNLQEKDLWGEMLRFIKESKAPIVFAENVTKKAIDIAQKDLSKIGYKVVVARVSNNLLGANHQRNRFWALAVKKDKESTLITIYEKFQKLPRLSGNYWTKKIQDNGKIDKAGDRRKQLKAIGNAQSPLVAAVAFRILTNRLYYKITALDNNKELSILPSIIELNKVFEKKINWIYTKYGKDFGFIHTPTTMANYSAPSMMKHRGCRNFVEVFEKPNPDNAEWLMGFPINASSLNSQLQNNLKLWHNNVIEKGK